MLLEILEYLFYGIISIILLVFLGGAFCVPYWTGREYGSRTNHIAIWFDGLLRIIGGVIVFVLFILLIAGIGWIGKLVLS